MAAAPSAGSGIAPPSPRQPPPAPPVRLRPPPPPRGDRAGSCLAGLAHLGALRPPGTGVRAEVQLGARGGRGAEPAVMQLGGPRRPHLRAASSVEVVDGTTKACPWRDGLLSREGERPQNQEGAGLRAPCRHGDAGSKVVIKTFPHQKAIFTSQGEAELRKREVQKTESEPVFGRREGLWGLVPAIPAWAYLLSLGACPWPTGGLSQIKCRDLGCPKTVQIWLLYFVGHRGAVTHAGPSLGETVGFLCWVQTLGYLVQGGSGEGGRRGLPAAGGRVLSHHNPCRATGTLAAFLNP